ncbi:BamA/TamA family outer membrane protein [Thalassotalea atypica]|uniref:BamA/TamA family outer membrane protein n=1 Tax=Thalassotalea atypica TaxID=2054316 RepID=UPI0025746FFB|nr:BamA/TamA family outer membrane protein [Thalassotalea atypica]
MAKHYRRHVFTTLLCLSTLPLSSYGHNLERDIKAVGEVQGQSLFIPYGFYNENTGTAAAAVFANTGYIQPQASSLVNIFAGSNSTYSMFAAFKDWQVPVLERLFVDTSLMVSDWGEINSYQDGNSNFINDRAGNIDSDEDNYVVANGRDNYLRMKFNYLFAIGDGEQSVVHEFKTQNGLLVKGYEAGGGEWNPLASGRTFFSVEPFYRQQDFSDDFDNRYENVTSGVKFSLEYDNSDWYKNPTQGSRTKLSFARDWGQEQESTTWSAIQFDYSKYISLGETDNARQRVLALNLWTSDVPTWNSYHEENGEKVYHRAPLFEGSTLGGIDRQRGYSTNRYHDRAAINYAAEYRYTPNYNPFTNMPLVNKLHIPYWQVVTFAEVGSVASNWSVTDLHKKMVVSAGAGVRISVAGLVIRADFAASEEGNEVQMFFGHNF